MGLDEDVGIWGVSESAHEIGAVIISAGESGTTDLNDLVLGGLDTSEGWGNSSDVWRGIERVGLTSLWVEDIMPVLSVEGDLHEEVTGGVDWRNKPAPLIDVESLWWDFLISSWEDVLVAVNESGPESILEMRSLKLVTVTLMSLWGTTVVWTS